MIISRGELVEIGGFRVPDAAPVRSVLREVGTTNRTRVNDTWHRLDGDGHVLRVHRPTSGSKG